MSWVYEPRGCIPVGVGLPRVGLRDIDIDLGTRYGELAAAGGKESWYDR